MSSKYEAQADFFAGEMSSVCRPFRGEDPTNLPCFHEADIQKRIAVNLQELRAAKASNALGPEYQELISAVDQLRAQHYSSSLLGRAEIHKNTTGIAAAGKGVLNWGGVVASFSFWTIKLGFADFVFTTHEWRKVSAILRKYLECEILDRRQASDAKVSEH